MRSISVLVVAAAALAAVAGNLASTAARTLVPRALSTTLAGRERRTEDHPGLDDAILWHLGDGRTIRVTDVVDELGVRGARLEKAAWEPTLRVNGEARALPWSDDVNGMARAAGPAVLATLVLAAAALRRGRAPRPPVQA